MLQCRWGAASRVDSALRKCIKGARLRQFSSSLDSVSARQMSQAIEGACEQVDAGEW